MKILADQLRAVEANLAMLDEQIEAWRQSSASAQALKTIPGVGTLISAALAAYVQTHQLSLRAAILRPGSGSFLDRTPAVAKTGSAGSQNRVIPICDDCSCSGRPRAFGG
jgi:transposase